LNLESPTKLETGAYITGLEEEGILLLMVVTAGRHGRGPKLGAVLINLAGSGIEDVYLAERLDKGTVERFFMQPLIKIGLPLNRISEEVAGSRLALAERVAGRRGNNRFVGLESIFEMLGKRARIARERTIRQLDEEEALASLPPEILRSFLKARLANLYNDWIERAAPELGGKTPRDAWRDRDARMEVERLLHEVLQIEEMRMRSIGVAYDAERLRVSLDRDSILSQKLLAVEDEVSDVLMLARVPPDARRIVYEGWRTFLSRQIPVIRNPRPWAAALYRVMQTRARLVPLDWSEICRLFGVSKNYAVKLARRIEDKLS